MIKKGFTLIELLIVIVIIGILAAVITTNFVAARSRAQDNQKKANLKELKTALRMYYVDYKIFPVSNMGVYLNGCGADGTARCPSCMIADFASGGADGCQQIYATQLEMSNTGFFNNMRYYRCDGGDDFRLKVSLSNSSDPDIVESQLKCPACGTTYSGNDYVLCNN